MVKKRESNEMFKAFMCGMLVGVIIVGGFWFFVGRNDLGEIRQTLNGVNGDFQRVQRTVGELGDNSNEFAGEISGISSQSGEIKDRSGQIAIELSGIDGEIRQIAGEVDNLEEWNRRSVILGRDIGDLAQEIRQFSEESRE